VECLVADQALAGSNPFDPITFLFLNSMPVRCVLHRNFNFIFVDNTDNVTTAVFLPGSSNPCCGRVIDADPPPAIIAAPMRHDRHGRNTAATSTARGCAGPSRGLYRLPAFSKQMNIEDLRTMDLPS
jgi:hypothetical protein